MSVNFNPDEKKILKAQESSSSIQVNQTDDLDESCFSVDAQNFEEIDNSGNIDLVDFEVSDELSEVEAQKNSKVLFFGNEGYTFKTNSGVEITVENPDDLGDIQVFENKETGEVFVVNANGAKITSSNENTSISIYNSKIQSINTKKGNDTINVYGSTIDNLNTGSGSDFVNIDDSSADKVKTSKDFLWGLFGSSNNSVNINNSDIEKLETGYGNDTVVLNDSEVESLETKGGVDSISSNDTEITKDDLAKKDLKVEDGNYLDDFDVSKMPQVESDEVITLESGESVNVSDYISLISQQEVGFETQEEYQQYTIQAISDNLESMKEIFQAQNDSDGVVANGFDALKELSNIGISSEDVNEVIAEQEEIINNLTQAMNGESEMSFEEAYEKYTGSEFSTEKIDKYIELSNIASAINSGCYYDKDYADKLEEATGKSVDEINQEFALCQNEVLGKSQALQNLVEDYSASQEGFADKLSSIISTSGMVCIAVGAVVSFIPGGAAIGVPLMAVGKNVALGGMLVDNAIDLVDYSTDKDGLTGDEVKNLALETGVELVSYGTGRAIGYGTNALNGLVSSKTAEAGISKAGSYILGQSAETLADTALSLTADYTIAQGQSLITTGELMDGDEYWSADRFLGEGQNQLMGILTGLSSAKVNAYSKDVAQKNADLKSQTDDVLKTGTNSNNGKPLQMDLQKFAQKPKNIDTQKPLQERMNEAITMDKITTLTEDQKIDMLSDIKLATKEAYEQALLDNESFQKVIYLSKIADPNGEPLSGRNITSLLALSNEDFQRIEDLIVVENRSKQFTGRNLVRFAELSDEELSIVKELLYLPERGEQQFGVGDLLNLAELSPEKLEQAKKLLYVEERGEQQFGADDIISLSELSAEDFAKAKTYFNIENGNGQKFSGNEIITLSKLNEEEFSKAQRLFNIPERGDEQLSLNEIVKITKELNDEQFANAENLLRIKNIDKQYSLSDIIEMSQKYSAEQLARFEKVSNIEGREEQFSSWDINKLIGLDEEQFARAEQLLYIENRDTQLSRFDISQIAEELNNEQFTLAQKLLYIEGRNKQLSGFDIRELAKEYDEQGLENISHLLNVPQRGENQFNVGEIESLSKLSPEEYKKAESLFNIPERGEQQFDGYSIAYLSKLSPEEYKKAESLFNIPERGEHQFKGGDIEKLITLDDQGMEKAKTLFNVTSRGEDQLSGSDIAELAELTDEQFARVDKLLQIKIGGKPISLYSIKDIAELSNKQFTRFIELSEAGLNEYDIKNSYDLDETQYQNFKDMVINKQYNPSYARDLCLVDETKYREVCEIIDSEDSLNNYYVHEICCKLDDTQYSNFKNLINKGVKYDSAIDAVRLENGYEVFNKLKGAIQDDWTILKVIKEKLESEKVDTILKLCTEHEFDDYIAVEAVKSLTTEQIDMIIEISNEYDIPNYFVIKMGARLTSSNFETAKNLLNSNFIFNETILYLLDRPELISNATLVKKAGFSDTAVCNLASQGDDIIELAIKLKETGLGEHEMIDDVSRYAYCKNTFGNDYFPNKQKNNYSKLVQAGFDEQISDYYAKLGKIDMQNLQTAIKLKKLNINDIVALELAHKNISESKIQAAGILAQSGFEGEMILTCIPTEGFDLESAKVAVKYINIGIFPDNALKLALNGIDLLSKINLVDIPKESQTEMFKNFFANNSNSDEIISNTDFTQFGKEGIPLEYSRTSFMRDLNKVLSNVPETQKTEILEKLNIELTQDGNGYNGIIDLTELSSEGTEGQVLELANYFILNNKVTTGDAELDQTLNSLITGMPEFINTIGKQQHDTHGYSLDTHILETYRTAISDSDYSKLSNYQKFELKLMTILHDISKEEGAVDDDHPLVSAKYASDILDRYNLSDSTKYDVVNNILNHHWGKDYNTQAVPVENTAVQMGTVSNYDIQKIFAKADLIGIGNAEFTNSKLESLSNDSQRKLVKALSEIKETTPLIYTTPIIKPDLIPSQTITLEDGSIKNIKSFNLQELPDDYNMEEFGFLPDTKAKDVTLGVHTANSTTEFTIFKMLTSDPVTSSPQSVSIVSKNDNALFKRFGVAINLKASDVLNATHYDQGCGTAKTQDDLINLTTGDNDYKSWREIIPNKIQEKLGITESEYSKLASIMEDYKYLSQISDTKEIAIGNKTFTGKEIKNAISTSQAELMQMTTTSAKANDGYHYSGDITELVVKRAEVLNNTYVLRYNSLDDLNNQDIPEAERKALSEFLSDIPDDSIIIFVGYDGYLYSSHANQWNPTKLTKEKRD